MKTDHLHLVASKVARPGRLVPYPHAGSQSAQPAEGGRARHPVLAGLAAYLRPPMSSARASVDQAYPIPL